MNDEVDLRLYLRAIWLRRGIVAAAVLTVMLAALALVSFLPPVYESEAIVLVQRSSVQFGGPVDSTQGPKISTVLASDLPMATFVAYAQLPSVMSKVAARVLGSGDSTLPASRRAQVVPATSLVELRVRSKDPKMAERVANSWAEVVASESAALFSTEAQRAYAFFAQQAGDARARLATAEEAQRRFNASSSISVNAARLQAVTGELAGFESRVNAVGIDLRKAQAELAEVEAQLKGESRKITLSKSFDADPLLRDAAVRATDNNVAALSRLKLLTEELNPLYIHLAESRANLAVRVASLAAERATLLDTTRSLSSEEARLRRDLAGQQLQESQVSRAVSNARQIYDVLVQRQEEVRAATGGQSGLVKLVAHAVEAHTPVAPNRRVFFSVAAFLGLVAGAVLALTREYLAGSFTAPALSAVPGRPKSVSTEPR